MTARKGQANTGRPFGSETENDRLATDLIRTELSLDIPKRSIASRG